MTTRPVGRRWYQFSLRRLLLVPLMLALALVPVAWVSRERRQLLRARDEALRAVILAERYRAELKRGADGDDPATPPRGRAARGRGAAILMRSLRPRPRSARSGVRSLGWAALLATSPDRTRDPSDSYPPARRALIF